MRTTAFVLVAALAACGGGTDPVQQAPLAPQPVDSSCQIYAFQTAFNEGPMRSVTEMDCTRSISQSEWETQEFTIYSNGATTLYLWANSLAVRVEGSAPDCIKQQLQEPVPRPPMKLSQCTMTTLVQ
jgi:hypothetical protein